MFQKLRIYFTIWYTVTTALILIAVMTAGYLYYRNQTLKQEKQTIENAISMVSYKLISSNIVEDSWISDQENLYHAIIHIEDNGLPFLYGVTEEQSKNRTAIIKKAKEKALSFGIDTTHYPIRFTDENITPIFKISNKNGALYYACTSQIVNTNSWQTITIIKDFSTILDKLRFLAMLVLGICILSIFLFLCMSWYITGKMLAPLEENQQKQKEFIAAASHELRSPLAVIRATVYGIQNAMERKENRGEKNWLLEAKEQLSDMDQEAIRMSKLIDSLLTLASAGTGNWTIHKKKTDLETFLIEAYDSFSRLMILKHIKFDLILPENPLPEISFDADRILQVLRILMDNAITYTPENSTIALRTGIQKQYIYLDVMDDGPGISDSHQKHIFDRFYQADFSRSDKNHFGLGLCIGKEIMELHGGGLIYLNDQCKGACFRILLHQKE